MRLEHVVDLDQMDLLALAVVRAVDERDDVQAVPDVRPDAWHRQPELLLELAAQRLLMGLAGVETATRQRPTRGGRELEAHQQHMMVGRAARSARTGLADAQSVGRTDARSFVGPSFSPSLNALYIS